MIREAQQNDLEQILNLYLVLHEKEIPSNNEHLRNTWQQIIDDKNHHLIACEIDGRIVSSYVSVIIPNLQFVHYVAYSLSGNCRRLRFFT